MTTFASAVIHWYQSHGRKDLPWQKHKTPYHVWLSEIMLQQTQYKTVIPYFERFVERFPTINDLAEAALDDVYSLWSGLGYYNRARYLHQTANIISKEYNSQFPTNADLLIKLPGIGKSTAHAILSIAFNQPTPILDGNVKRVLCRVHKVSGHISLSKTEKKLWQLAISCMPKKQCGEYTQAMMDLGALICTKNKPHCINCPVNTMCQAFKDKVVNSYPEPKPKREPLPIKKLFFALVYTDDGQLVMKKRENIGVWQGLWAFPEHENLEMLLQQLNEKGVANFKEMVIKTAFRHTFSHYHLWLTPIIIKIADPKPLKDLSMHWFTILDAYQLGLPKPIRYMIESYLEPLENVHI